MQMFATLSQLYGNRATAARRDQCRYGGRPPGDAQHAHCRSFEL